MPATLESPTPSTEVPDRTLVESVAPTVTETGPSEKELVRSAFAKENLTWRSVDPIVVLWIGAMHIGAIAAPFFFTWTALGVCIGLHWFTCSIGICLGYHRYLSHRSFKLRGPAEFVAMFAGTLSAEGRPLKWAATHRVHHQKSDQDGDPHSPTEGSLWSHLLWMFRTQKPEEERAVIEKYVPELADRPILNLFENHYAKWVWGTSLAIFGIGWAIGGWAMAVSMLLWGVCMRMVVSYHSTWLVNSATHIWGYRNYETRDHSRNLWWVALFSYGEGWHNNHHAHPAVAPAGHRWWEIDMTWWAIKALRAVGLAYDVKDAIPSKTRPAGDGRESLESGKPNETLAA